MKNLLAAIVLVLIGTLANAQVGIGTVSPDASSSLELQSTDKGFLIPRMTEAQKDAISSPAEGLMVYQNDGNAGFYYYNSVAWQGMEDASNVVYAQLSDSTVQEPPSTDPMAIKFSTNDEVSGVGHTANESTITVLTSGVYNMVAQPQVNRNSNSGVVSFHSWFQWDIGSGWVDMPNSNVLLDMNSTSVDDVIVISVTTYLNAGDKVRVMMSTSDTDKDVMLLPRLNITNEPNIPSIIFTMFKL